MKPTSPRPARRETIKIDNPTIAFDLPTYRYVGDSATVKTAFIGADTVTWELNCGEKTVAVPEGFTKDSGTLKALWYAEHDILKLLDVLLLNEIEAAEKKQVLQRDFIFP